MNKTDRILGSLIGFAIGDAMGATTEFMSPEQIKETYGTVKDIIGGGWLHIGSGQVTDDTQMMMCVYRAMREADGKGLIPTLRLVCRNFRDWADSNPPDIGGACKRAIYGTNWTEPEEWVMANLSRQREQGYEDLGNGGLMRCLVPCLLGDITMAIKQGLLTHSNNTSEFSIENYYGMIRNALEGKRRRLIMPCASNKGNGHVQNTLVDVEWFFVHSKSFEECILRAVNNGDDADTVAALTGGLAGAYYGLEGIPNRWIGQLDTTVYSELVDCADWVCSKVVRIV